MKRLFGFTLLELIIVMVIIGVLATLGITQFVPARERALGQEAVGNLKLIAAAEKIWRMEDNANNYANCVCTTIAVPPAVSDCDNALVPATAANPASGGCNTLLRLRLTANNWQYNVVATLAVPSTFIATATRTARADLIAASYGGCQYSITQAQNAPQVVVGTNCAYNP